MPPPVSETGPYYSDVAAWSSILSTTLPMFGGFMLVATADRSGNEEEVGMQVAGIFIVSLGVIVGPSVGHLYAGDLSWGLSGIGLRLLTFSGSAGFVVGGLIIASEDRDAEAVGGMMVALGAASGAVGLGLVIADLLDSPEAARRANAEHRKKPGAAEIALAPDVEIGAGSLALRWRY